MQTLLRWLEQFGRDLALAWRSLRRSPTFAVVVVATIAIGIGANATVLGIMDVAFLRKLPVPDPDRIVRVLCGDSSRSGKWAKAGASSCSFPEARDLSQSVQGINGLAAYTMSYVKLGGEYSGIEPYGSFVSGNYFAVLGVRPQRGRYIAPDDADPTQPRAVVVISDVLWRGTFGADENAVGRRIVIGNSEFTVIGIAPKDWSGVHPEGRTDFWLPYTTRLLATGKDDYESRDARVIWPRLVGRLSAGASLGQVQGGLDNAAQALALRYPASNATIRYRATLRSTLVDGPDAMNALSGFLVALIVVALVHLVACSNVASLMLGRAAARRRELGIRLCLGASRGRIFVSTLAEPLLLGALGGAGGLIVSRWFTGLITSMWFMSALNPGLDVRVITLVAIVSAGTALLFGLAPALLSARRDPMEVLRSASATSASSLGSPASILVLQAALSLVLLAQSQLLVGKWQRENAAALGFDDAHVVTAQLQSSKRRAARDDWKSLYEVATQRAAAVSGVSRVSVALSAPLQFGGWTEPVSIVNADGVIQELTTVFLAGVGPGYFGTLGAPLAAGREFTSDDRWAADQKNFDVAIVNEGFARRYWPGREPIGQTVTFRKTPARVVGVVRDMRDFTLSGIAPRVYFPMLEWSYPRFAVVTRVEGDAEQVAQRLRGALAGLPDADPPVVRTVADARADQLLVSRVLSLVLSACAAIALLLTAIGLYGAVSMWAAARRTEIGIRLALGARARHVYRLLMLGAGKFTGGGIALGALLSIALVRIEQATYGPSLAFEAGSLAAAALVFIVVTCLAAFVPSRRASQAPPVDVLRSP